MRRLVLLLALACFLTGLAPRDQLDGFVRLGVADDGSDCELTTPAGRSPPDSLVCGDHLFDTRRLPCQLLEERRYGRGFRHELVCEKMVAGQRLRIDTRDGSTALPLPDGGVRRVRWQRASWVDSPREPRGFFDPPVQTYDAQWVRWIAVAALLLATLIMWLWERRGRVPRDLDLVQLAVDVPAWPPSGPLRVLPAPARGLPDAAWPADTPLSLREDAPLDAPRPGPGTWWIAGRREGGRGGGLREAEPRLEPSPTRGYVLRRRPMVPRDFASVPPLPVVGVAWWCSGLVAAVRPDAPYDWILMGLIAAGGMIHLTVTLWRARQRG